MVFELVAVMSLGYLLGSIPWSVIVSRYYGVDILKVGSGNPGATNVRRVLGKGPARLVFFLDAAKGFIASSWAQIPALEAANPTFLGVVGLSFAVLGATYSCFLGFRGGKGLAVSIGALAGVMPSVLFLGLLVWIVVFGVFRYVSLASICMSLSLPFWVFVTKGSALDFIIALTLAVFIPWRHRSNIRRLLDGVEQRFSKFES